MKYNVGDQFVSAYGGIQTVVAVVEPCIYFLTDGKDVDAWVATEAEIDKTYKKMGEPRTMTMKEVVEMAGCDVTIVD